MSKTPGGGLAHPRSRGEHLDSLVACLHQVGSSPLARGTPFRCCGVSLMLRLIPARAGNMHASTKPAASCPAHPRSRGEHITAICILLMAPGSSPLARGTCRTHRHNIRKHRLIPARAGNTSVAATSSSLSWAHPRSREESSMLIGSACGRTGSSPLALARGTFAQILKALRLARLIPACAGNTTIISPPLRHHKAHPRSSGEHSPLTTSKMVVVGSSPLARGTRTGRRPRLPRAGLIPARAGNILRFLG